MDPRGLTQSLFTDRARVVFDALIRVSGSVDRSFFIMNSVLPLVSPFRLLAVSLGLCAVALPGRAADWVGTVNSDFSLPSNWQGTPPRAGMSNPRAENFYVVNESLIAMNYTAREGDTVIGSPDASTGQFLVGTLERSGCLEMSGGSLRIFSYWSPIIGQNGNTTIGTVYVRGGTLRIGNTSRTLARERFFRVGNSRPNEKGARGVIFVSGGLVVIETEGGADPLANSSPDSMFGGFNIGRCGADGLVYLTGGILRITSPYGTSFVPDNGPAVGILTFGLGGGVFEQTNSSRITFGTGATESYITFTPGSKGALSLARATRKTFDDLIAVGGIRIDGAMTDPSRFLFTEEGFQGVLRLATAQSTGVK
ncbi:MAG: hypothetical protein RIQ79_819 [Verrucomicrobiota bacterium]